MGHFLCLFVSTGVKRTVVYKLGLDLLQGLEGQQRNTKSMMWQRLLLVLSFFLLNWDNWNSSFATTTLWVAASIVYCKKPVEIRISVFCCLFVCLIGRQGQQWNTKSTMSQRLFLVLSFFLLNRDNWNSSFVTTTLWVVASIVYCKKPVEISFMVVHSITRSWRNSRKIKNYYYRKPFCRFWCGDWIW